MSLGLLKTSFYLERACVQNKNKQRQARPQLGLELDRE